MYREHTTQDVSDRLLLNDEKTEHLLIGTCQQLETIIHQVPHTICDSENINIFRIEKYFSQDAWFKVFKILQKKEEAPWNCKVCSKAIRDDQESVARDRCLVWYHFLCSSLTKPKSKMSYC